MFTNFWTCENQHNLVIWLEIGSSKERGNASFADLTTAWQAVFEVTKVARLESDLLGFADLKADMSFILNSKSPFSNQNHDPHWILRQSGQDMGLEFQFHVKLKVDLYRRWEICMMWPTSVDALSSLEQKLRRNKLPKVTGTPSQFFLGGGVLQRLAVWDFG